MEYRHLHTCNQCPRKRRDGFVCTVEYTSADYLTKYRRSLSACNPPDSSALSGGRKNTLGTLSMLTMVNASAPHPMAAPAAKRKHTTRLTLQVTHSRRQVRLVFRSWNCTPDHSAISHKPSPLSSTKNDQPDHADSRKTSLSSSHARTHLPAAALPVQVPRETPPCGVPWQSRPLCCQVQPEPARAKQVDVN